tara:strand:- start:232 stop:492 length:261 start_codon:yes stop_codon:yes gene_type:complete
LKAQSKFNVGDLVRIDYYETGCSAGRTCRLVTAVHEGFFKQEVAECKPFSPAKARAYHLFPVGHYWMEDEESLILVSHRPNNPLNT